MFLRLVLITLLLLTVSAQAQPKAPVLTAEQTARLQIFELQVENLTLRIQLLQQQLQKTQTEAREYVVSQEKDGFVLTRDNEGWKYTQKKND